MKLILLVLYALLSSCSVIFIEGGTNTIDDANSHGDFGLWRPDKAASAPAASAPLQPRLLQR